LRRATIIGFTSGPERRGLDDYPHRSWFGRSGREGDWLDAAVKRIAEPRQRGRKTVDGRAVFAARQFRCTTVHDAARRKP